MNNTVTVKQQSNYLKVVVIINIKLITKQQNNWFIIK